MGNEVGDITTNIMHIQRIIRKYKEFNADKFDNSDKMENFLEKYKPTKFTTKKYVLPL